MWQISSPSTCFLRVQLDYRSKRRRMKQRSHVQRLYRLHQEKPGPRVPGSRRRCLFSAIATVPRNVLISSFILLTAANTTVVLSAQTTKGQAATEDVQKQLDRLIE